MQKKCKRCGVVLPIAYFYAHPMTRDRLSQNCKQCSCGIVRSARARNTDYYKAFDVARATNKTRAQQRKEYAHSPQGKEGIRKRGAKWRKNNKEKKRCHTIVRAAVRAGKLIKGNCVLCGKKLGVCAHHEDYTKPLQVVWLCYKHHNDYHLGKVKKEW